MLSVGLQMNGMTRRLSFVAMAVILAGCSSSRQGSYSYVSDGMLSREAIELHEDGTFVYCAWSDDGPSLFSAHGRWRWLDRAHRRLETVTLGRRVERGKLSLPDDLEDVVVWKADDGTLQRTNRPLLRRKSGGALVNGGCTLPPR